MESAYFFFFLNLSGFYLMPTTDLLKAQLEAFNDLNTLVFFDEVFFEEDKESCEKKILLEDLIENIKKELDRRYLAFRGNLPEEEECALDFAQTMNNIVGEEEVLALIDEAPLDVVLCFTDNVVCAVEKKAPENMEPKRENLKSQKLCETLKTSRPRKSKSSAQKRNSKS